MRGDRRSDLLGLLVVPASCAAHAIPAFGLADERRGGSGRAFTIKGWMILIAFVAVATAVSRRAPISVCVTIAVVPSLLVTGILAKQRRRQGMPMSDWEWTVSAFQITAGFMVMLFVVLELAAYIVSLYWPH